MAFASFVGFRLGLFYDFVFWSYGLGFQIVLTPYKKILDLDLRFRKPVLGLIDLKN